MTHEEKNILAELIQAYKTRMEKLSEEITGKAIGMVLYGSRKILSMLSISRGSEFGEFILEITDKIKRSSTGLNHLHISQALYALSGIEVSKLTERARSAVVELVSALTDKIKNSEAELDGQAIGNALYGLKGIEVAFLSEAQTSAVVELLFVFSDKVCKCRGKLSRLAISAALYGLRGIEIGLLGLSERDKVKKLLRRLGEKINDLDRQLIRSNSPENVLRLLFPNLSENSRYWNNLNMIVSEISYILTMSE